MSRPSSKAESVVVARARVDRGEEVVVTRTRSSGGTRYTVRLTWRDKPLAFGFLSGPPSRMRAVVRALTAALGPAPERRRSRGAVTEAKV